jgi:hypothetical protein
MIYAAVAAFVVSASPHGRALSYESILSYPSGSQVTDHANIDLDQAAMEVELNAGDFTAAKAIYTKGAHSKPKAVCTLVSPTTMAGTVAAKSAVTFTDAASNTISTAKTAAEYTTATKEIEFTYKVSATRVQAAGTECYVGGLPTAKQTKTAGCLPTPASPATSTFTIDGQAYTATCANKAGRTLQGFSTKAKKVMYDCPVDSTVTYTNGCPYTSYKPYYDYYGDYAYADTLVLSALDKTNGAAGFTYGGQDLSAATDDVRLEFTKKGTAYLNSWMYTIREFEDAIDDCTVDDLTANALSSGPVHAWDEGVAFYAGSLMEFDHLLAGSLPTLDKKGKLSYTLGNKRCKNFKTCGPNGDALVGEAKVNIDLFDDFRKGQHELLVGNCAAVVPWKNAIVKKMTVPLIQGTLRYSYKIKNLQGSLKEKGEGGVFAAAVLPQVHACDPAAAKIIYDNMRADMKPTSSDFMAVKAAFEGCYSFMGVTCADVGGLYKDATTGYYADNGDSAAPCTDASTSSSSSDDSTTVALAAGIGGGVAGVLLLLVIFMVCKEKSGKPLFYDVNSGGKVAA